MYEATSGKQISLYPRIYARVRYRYLILITMPSIPYMLVFLHSLLLYVDLHTATATAIIILEFPLLHPYRYSHRSS